MDAPTPPIRAMIAPVTPLQQNCTIVWCTKTMKGAIIDPGGEVDRLLKGLETYGVTLGETQFEVIHCPGHTPGHVVFFHREARFAQVGDVLFKGSIGRTDFPRGNYNDLIEAISTKLWPLGDDVSFVPGHGPMSTFGYERKVNPYVSDLALQSNRIEPASDLAERFS